MRVAKSKQITVEVDSSHALSMRRAFVTSVLLCHAVRAAAQEADTTKPVPLPAVTVAVTRAEAPLERLPWAVQIVDPLVVARGRPAWGMDEVLGEVPGVLVANRHNFSVDQRLSIRGFGARSAFAVRGVRVVFDGIPLTLPDGQGQLTTVDFGAVQRIEVLRGTASSLFGNAAGGVLNITTQQPGIIGPAGRGRLLLGAFDRDLRRAWSKWQVESNVAIGQGNGRLAASRLVYDGERDHTAADLLTFSGRAAVPLGRSWTVTLLGDVGHTPLADNPGALTAAELQANPDSAAPLNILRDAGKAVSQVQGGVSLRGTPLGYDVTLGAFGLTRDLENPLPQAVIGLDRRAAGFRLAVRRKMWTAGIDAQWQRDERIEYSWTADNRPGFLTRDQLEQVSELGPFAQLTLDVSPMLTLTVGLRHDAVRFKVTDHFMSDSVDNSGARTYAATSGSAGIAVIPARGLTFFANAGTSFETPTTTELNNQPPPGGGGFNFDLEPQRAASFEVGARGVGDLVTWSATVFTADVRDELIAFEDTLVPGRRYYRNAARARHKGLELGATLRPAGGLSLVLAWTISDFRYTSYQIDSAVLDGRAIPGIPRHGVRGSLRLEPPWARGLWSVIEANHTSAYFVDDTLDARTEAWTAVDARLGWEGRLGQWQLAPFVAVQNLFDLQYVSSVVINAARGRYYEPAPGRNAYFGVELTASRKSVEEKRRGAP